MDNQKLDKLNDETLAKILREDHTPEIDVNARKRALNLAVAEFKTVENENNQKSSQGISILSRLMGKTNISRGENTMEQKTKKTFMYGGMATAMAVILVGSLSLTQLNETVQRNADSIAVKDDVEDPIHRWRKLREVRIQRQMASKDGIKNLSDEVDDAVKDWHREDSEMATSKTDNDSNIGKNNAEGQEAIYRWRALQTEDVPRQMKKNAPLVGELQDGNSAGATASVSDFARQRPAEKSGLDSWSRNTAHDKAAAPVAPPAAAVAEQEAGVPARTAPSSSLLKGKRKKLLGEKKESTQGSTLYNKNKMVVESIAPYPDTNPYGLASEDLDRDQFETVTLNTFKQVSSEPVSTFSSDVDTASYSFVRNTLNNGRLPAPSRVRTEEMVNYFDYNYPLPESRSVPFKPTVTVMDSPWTEGRKLMHIGIKGYALEKTELRSNLVFLLDVSGSMNQRDKLPLVKSSMNMLLDSLHPDDTVSIVTYAGSTGVVLEPTKVSQKSKIINAMNNLHAGGGTAGAAGINLAYDMAEQNFDKHAVNRVILATDGDFNVGITNRDELKRYIEKKREKGIFLSVLGFGMGNYNDHLMQTLAQNGNGIAAYIDSLKEAQKVLVQEATSSLFPIAKDVKFQVEFNPAAVAEYRLIGYETRSLKREDFNNDKIDAGDIGAGHTVTALYEFVPVGSDALTVDPLHYGSEDKKAKKTDANPKEYAFLKIRYKLPMENKSKLISQPVKIGHELNEHSKLSHKNALQQDVRFSVAVAAFAQKLQGGQYTNDFSYDDIIKMAQNSRGQDPYGYRSEFIQIVRMAKTLAR